MDEDKTEDKLVDEGLINLLFPHKSSRDEFDSEFEKYLASLTSYSLDRLNKEPDLLKQEGNRIKQQMEDLAFRNYKAFIQTADCVQSIHQQIENVSGELNIMIHRLPGLSQTCKEFVTKAQDITQRRSKSKNTLNNYNQLVEILEIPQLMDTCVRNGYYDEALELEQFTQKLYKAHPKNPIIQDLVREVKLSTDVMLFQLQAQLKSNIQLPACLRVIGYLKRLGVFNDKELRMSFLQSRGAWLASVLNSINTSNPYNYLTKLTDYSRTHLFDIITQYRAIFSDETDQSSEAGLLYGWLTQIISEFLSTLEMYLPQITEGLAIANLIDQCMYYGISLGRVGVDFRALLIPLFEKCIYTMFSNNISLTTNYFADTIKTFKFQQPPKSIPSFSTILDYAPVAILTNGYLSSLNELRQCAAISLQDKLANRLSQGFQTVANTMQAIHKQYKDNPTTSKETLAQIENVCMLLAEKFIPHIVKCFSLLYHTTKSVVTYDQSLQILQAIYHPTPVANESNTILNGNQPSLNTPLQNGNETASPLIAEDNNNHSTQ